MNIVVPQPLYYPAPVVAYGTKPTVCYTDPRFIGEYNGTAFDGVNVADYQDLQTCGKAALYTGCSTGNTLVVAYPTTSTPHGFVKYGSACFSFTGTILTTGTFKPVPAGSVAPVASCLDPACASASTAGALGSSGTQTLVYFTRTSSGTQEVGVYFDHLESGTARYGVCPVKVDTGLSGLSAGSAWLYFVAQPRLLAMVSGGTGILDFRVIGAHFIKRLIVIRAGVEVARYSLSKVAERATLQVQPLDQVYLDAAAITGRLNTFATKARVNVQWSPSVSLPRLYDTGTLQASGSLVAVGFCGIVPQQTYTYFGTLPADQVTTGLINPDTLVTVQGTGSEYVLVRSRGQGDQEPDTLGLAWYGSQTLNAPILFRFYAGREIQGQHGEMDVWLNVAGTFPGTFSLDPYRVITRGSASYRRAAEPGDLRRGSLEVQQSTATFFLPGQYHGPDGQLLTFHSTAGALVHEGVTYTRVGSDPGLSYEIL